MKNQNSRGFTLIEMLAVIAIIAILVSVIVPVVTNASDKATAAADAANLRSAKATIAQMLLDGTLKANETSISAEAVGIPPVSNYQNQVFQASVTEGEITVSYGELTIDFLADIADNGKDDQSNAASQTVPTEGNGK